MRKLLMLGLMEMNEYIARATAKALAEGRQGEKFDTAMRMSRLGLPISEIMQVTELTMSELSQILPTLKN